MKPSKDLTPQTFGFYIVLTLALIVLLSFFYLLTPFFYVICWAGILAFFIYPVYKFVMKKLKGKKRLSAFIVLGCFLLFLIGPFLSIVLNFYSQAVAFLEKLQPITKKDLTQFFLKLNQHPKLSMLFSKFTAQLQPYLPQIQAKFTQFVSGLLQAGISSFKNVVKFLASFGFQLAFTLITLYYFLIDGEKLVKEITSLIPGDEEEKQRVLDRTAMILKGVLYGNILTALVQGVLAFIIYFALGIPQYLLWAFLTILASFIPVFGTSIVWFPVGIYLVIKGSYVKATILYLYSILLISQIDNFLKPLFIGEKTKIHNLLIFFSVIGGLIKFGTLGLFLGPLILGLFLSIIEIYKIKCLNRF
ncbi:MAG: AI-2E family transporter [Thermodesulfobacteria bacterium]|nr:AI-2E family transporter [Thermodesulfobacteriota bacterium]